MTLSADAARGCVQANGGRIPLSGSADRDDVKDHVSAGTASARSKKIALVATLLAVAMTFIDQTIVAIASPAIQSELSLTRTGIQWAVNEASGR